MTTELLDNPTTATNTAAIGRMILLTFLAPSPLNPRKTFPQGEMDDLQVNIEKHGVLVPLLVRKGFSPHVIGGELWEVIDGERRYRAAKAAGVTAVPCIERNDLTDGEVIEIQLLSAIQRQDLTPLEEAHGYQSLIASNPARYSVAYIADRIGRSERYVWDRMQLLQLIAPAQDLLKAERILVGHAERLAKLKPEDQARAIGWDDGMDEFEVSISGLWERAPMTLDLDPDAVGALEDEDALAGYKARTVKELEYWIARNVRLDVAHLATTAPLDFGSVLQRVEEAQAQPGRGKKVVAITFDYACPSGAKSDERTYGQNAWKRANGSGPAAPTCDHAVLGTVVAGRHYGQAFDVCVAKDRCATHWKDEIKAREKAAKLREQGKGGQAAQHEALSAKQANDTWKAQQEARLARQEAWEALQPHIVGEAVAQVKAVNTLTAAQVKFLARRDQIVIDLAVCAAAGVNWAKKPLAAVLVSDVSDYHEWNTPSFDDYVATVAKPLGLNLKRLAAVRDQHQPKAPAPAKTPTPAKAATKTAKGKKR